MGVRKKLALLLSVAILSTSISLPGGIVARAEQDMEVQEGMEDIVEDTNLSEEVLEDEITEPEDILGEDSEVDDESYGQELEKDTGDEEESREDGEVLEDKEIEITDEEFLEDYSEELRTDNTSLIEELDGKLDGIMDELYEIEMSVSQDLRDRLADISTQMNAIDDWASKEAIFNKHTWIEEDINIKDQLGYLKGQIDAYLQNPNPDLKDRIQGEINTLRARIKDQKLSDHARNNDYQLDLLEGILGGKSDNEIEDEIREILDRIRNNLEDLRGEIAGESTRKDVNQVKDLIGELSNSNDKKAEFNDELNELLKDIAIKDQLDDLEGDIDEYLNNPDSDLKSIIESKIIIIRGQINGESLSPHSDHNREKLDRLIEKFNQKNGESEKEKEKNIEELLEKIKRNLSDLNGGPAGQDIRADYDRLEGLISELADSNAKKANFIKVRKNLKEDIDIKDDLQGLLEEVDKFLEGDDNSSKNEIDTKIEEMRGRIKSQVLSPHKDHNNSRLKDIIRKIEDREVESEKEKEKNIDDLLEKIKSDLAGLNGGPSGETIRIDYEKVVDLISKLPETNKNKSSYVNKSANLKEDIDIKDDIFKLAGKVGIYEKESSQNSSLRDEIISEYFRLKGVIAREILSPHKEHNDSKLMELKDRIDKKDKETEGQIENDIENRLNRLEKDLADLKGEPAPADIEAVAAGLKEDILKLNDSNIKKDKFLYRMGELEDDIQIKKDISQVNELVNQYENYEGDKDAFTGEINSKGNNVRMRIVKERLEPHKIDNMDKLDRIRSRFEDMKDKEGELAKNEITNLLEKIKNDLEDLNGEKPGQGILDDLGRVKSMISKLAADNKDLAIYNERVKDLEEDILIKYDLDSLSKKVLDYKDNRSEEVKKEIEKNIEDLSKRIENQVLMPHDIHNKNKLIKLRGDFESDREEVLEEDILKLLEEIRQDLEALNGGDVKQEIGDKYNKALELISKLSESSKNKEKYLEEASYLEEDIRIKDWLKDLSEKMDEYVTNEDDKLKEEVIDMMQKLKGSILDQKLSPHKDHNMKRLVDIYNRFMEKESDKENKQEEEILILLEKIKLELAERDGSPALESTRKDYLRLEDLIDSLSSKNENKVLYIEKSKELKEDIEIKDELNSLSKKVDDYLKDQKEELKSGLEKEINILRGRIKAEILEPHKSQNLNKLRLLEESIREKEETIEAEKEADIVKLLEEVKEELELKNGEKSEDSTRLKLEDAKKLIDQLKKTNTNKANYILAYKELSKDIGIKDDLNILSRDMDEYIKTGEESDRSRLIDEIIRLRGVITGEKISPHKDHNLKKLTDIYNRFLSKEEGDLSKKEDEIEKLLIEIKNELELQKGEPIKSETGRKMERVYELIDLLPDTSKKKAGFNKDFNNLYEDAVIKNQVKYINDRILEFKERPSKELEKEIRDTSGRILDRIEKQVLVPHKDHNLAKLKGLLDDFEKEIEVEENIDDRITYLLEDIQRRLAELKGEQAPLGLKNDMNELEKLINDLDSKNPKKRLYMESAKLLRMDIKIKDELKELEEEINRIKLLDEYRTMNNNLEKLIVFNSTDMGSLKISLKQELYNNIKDLDEIKEELKEAEGSINQEKLYPHGKHNRDKLLKLNSSLINKKLGVISEALARLNGEPADKEIKEEILKMKEEIELMDLDEDEIKYERKRLELGDDVKIKDDLASLKKDIEKLSKSSSSKDKSRAKDEIYRLEKAIKGQKIEPHKTDNFNKLLSLEKLYKKKTSDSTNIKPEGGGSTGGGHKDKDRDKNKDKDRDKDLENIDKDLEEIEKDIKDKEAGSDKDIGEIEKDIEAVEKDIDKLTNKKDRDDRNNKLDKLKDRLEKLRTMVVIDDNYHKSYMTGYKDGSIRPKDTTTREEVAKVIYSILDDKKLEKFRTKNHNFKDLKSGTWSEEYVATLTRAGILTGYSDGSFKPKKEISRGELAAIVAKINGLYEKDTSRFNDISDHWARGYINAVSEKSWIKGYEDGSFRPKNYITRAEFVTMINSMLNRNRKSEGSLDDIKKFNDLEEGKWYYDEIIEAVTDHRP